MHDHFGFFMAYGSTCWVLTIYTSQAWYLVYNPIQLTNLQMLGILAINMIGYIFFRMTNNQKLIFREAQGNVSIWGRPAMAIEAKYSTADGKERRSLLLCSGFWGLSRHFNYLTDLLITASFCMCCGITHLIPWTYQVHAIFFLSSLTFLLHC